MQINADTYYDIDVSMWYGGALSTDIHFGIYVNGIYQFTAHIPTSMKPYPQATSGRFGPYVRGSTAAEFQYLYGSTFGTNDAIDDGGFFDRIAGGYQSSQLMKEWIYSTRTAYTTVKGHTVAYTQRYNQLFVDDFSTTAHEVREFDVKFTKVPVLYSRLYLSNETQLICPTYNSGPFGAKFVIGNTARVNAIAAGSDTLMFGIDSPVTQQTLIYGRTVTQAAESKYEINDQLGLSSRGIRGVNRRGEMALTVSSPWLQTLAAAEAVGDWIQLNWGTGQDEMVLVSFANPLIQLGDLVAINYATLDMSAATHKFFVVGVGNAYSNGPATTFTLRRANI
jgi:hypothetical protein